MAKNVHGLLRCNLLDFTSQLCIEHHPLNFCQAFCTFQKTFGKYVAYTENFTYSFCAVPIIFAFGIEQFYSLQVKH